MLDSTLSSAAPQDTFKEIETSKFADAQHVIQKLQPIQRLPEKAISALAELTVNLSVPAGIPVSDLVRDSAFVHYLVEGTLALIDANNNKKTLSAGDAKCDTAIDRRLNGSVDLIAETDCFLARVPWSDLENFLLQHAPDELESSSLEVKEILTTTCSDWMVRLLQSDLISMLPAANIQEVLASVDVLQLSPEEIVINQGDDPDHFYIIEAGKFSVFRDIKSTGRQVELATLSTGDFFGEEALITGDKRGTSVKAATTAKLLKVNGEQFKKSIVEPTIVQVSLDDAHEQLTESAAVLIDVRTSEQYKQGHIPNSINLVLQLLRINSNQLDKTAKYVVGADNLNAAAVATFLLRVRGFDATYLEQPLENYTEKFEITLDANVDEDKPRITSKKAAEDPEPAPPEDPAKPTLAQITELAAKHAGGDEKPAAAEDYANTVTGIGLADLIEELNDSYETEAELAPNAPLTEAAPNHLHEVQEQLTEEADFSIDTTDTIEELNIESEEAKPARTENAKQLDIDSEVARLVDIETKKLKAEFEKEFDLKAAKNKRAALQALTAHKQKLDLQFRAKQKTLLANSQKLIALANKISQQKAEVEKARKILAASKTAVV